MTEAIVSAYTLITRKSVLSVRQLNNARVFKNPQHESPMEEDLADGQVLDCGSTMEPGAASLRGNCLTAARLPVQDLVR